MTWANQHSPSGCRGWSLPSPVRGDPAGARVVDPCASVPGIPEAVDPHLPSLLGGGGLWVAAVGREVGLREGFEHRRWPDPFTSVNIYRARSGEEVGGRGCVCGKGAWARDPRERQRPSGEAERRGGTEGGGRQGRGETDILPGRPCVSALNSQARHGGSDVPVPFSLAWRPPLLDGVNDPLSRDCPVETHHSGIVIDPVASFGL